MGLGAEHWLVLLQAEAASMDTSMGSAPRGAARTLPGGSPKGRSSQVKVQACSHAARKRMGSCMAVACSVTGLASCSSCFSMQNTSQS